MRFINIPELAPLFNKLYQLLEKKRKETLKSSDLRLTDQKERKIPPLVAQMAKNLPAMQKTQVCSRGWEDPLEKGMATHFSILPWRIPWIEEPGRLQFMWSQRVGHD